MKKIILLHLTCLYSFFCSAQENVVSPDVAITGALADGKPSPPAEPAKVPRFEIVKSYPVESEAGGRRIHEVADPNLPILPADVSSGQMSVEKWEAFRLSPAYQKLRAAYLLRKQTKFISISATVYDHRCTYLRWWIDNKQYSAWSNVDFNYLGGFCSFRKGDQEYMLFMGLGNVDSEQIRKRQAIKGITGYTRQLVEPPTLPLLDDQNPFFQKSDGSKNVNEEEVVTVLHHLYAQEHERLKAAFVSREEARKAKEIYLRDHPPQEQIAEIYFWRGKRHTSSDATQEKVKSQETEK